MLPRNAKLLSRAKEMRKNMTPQERHLWHVFLKNYPIKFYRQKIIDNYIVDFYCATAKLVVELDGSQHFEPDNMKYDKLRTERFASMNIKVIRFTNRECEKIFKGVCMVIENEVNKRC